MIGDYNWVLTDTGYAWVGSGVPTGCGPGCCGGCKAPRQLDDLLKTKPFQTEDNSDKFNHYSKPYTPDILSNYVTKKELQDALDEVRGICGYSIDKENSGRCTKSRGHTGFCDNINY